MVIDAESQDQAFPEQPNPMADHKADVRGHGSNPAIALMNRSSCLERVSGLIWTASAPNCKDKMAK
jgi:hypothetical protein